MEMRAGRRSEIRDIANLWVHTFPDGPLVADRIRTLEQAGPAAGGIETVTVALDEGRLAGALKSLRFTQHFGGSSLPMFGLAAVAVAPWARRRGVAGILCENALRQAFERGDAVSGLYPFRPAFYRRLGWSLTGELHSYRFTPEQLADPGDPGVHRAESADSPAIQACYARAAESSNGLIDRDAIRWKLHIERPATHFFVAKTGATVDGYAAVQYGRARSVDRRPLTIRELVTSDESATRRLLGFISRQRDLWRRIRYDAAPDEHFERRLSDPRPPNFRNARSLWSRTANVIRGPMLRILNVELAFSMRRVWGAAPAFGFRLTVDDPRLPANAGPWQVTFDGTSASIVRGGDSASDATTLAVDAPTLAELYSGELAPSAAQRLGTARISGDTAALDAFFRPSSSFRLLDEF